ncbi:hypothetical protein LJR234_002626 [Mesorhizobium amorphae]|uniref:hypothetical protein n=1 Tax=Mesorhizobium amorphae TaxID=71433 RepID=UPI003ED0CA66
MTKLSDLGPPIIGTRHGTQPASESGHFHKCPSCGQAVDWRDLRQVIWQRLELDA